MPAAGRIVFNGKFLSSDLTGVHRVAFELMRACREVTPGLCSNGLDMELAVPDGEILPRWHATSALAGLEIRRGLTDGHLWEQIELPLHSRGQVLVNLCNLAPVFKRKSVTMIHDAHTFNVPSSYPLIFRAAYRAALPLIGHVHAAIVTVSEYSKSELVRNNIASADKITVVYNGVDHMLRFNVDVSILETLGLTGAPFFVGLSSVQPHKNIKMIINAFRDRRLESVRCVLIGPDRREEFAREGVVIPDNVVFSGILTDDRLRGLLENSIATLCPSTTEGFGLLPLEGMILGCPTIVAPCGSLPEVCGAAAIYAEPDDEEKWIAAIADLRDAPEHRTMYSALGVAQAQKFTWSRAASRLLDVCDRIAYSPVSIGVAR